MAQYPDRFIPQRYTMDFEQSYFILSQNFDNKRINTTESMDFGIIHSAKATTNANNYINELRNCVLGENKQKRVLLFSSSQNRNQNTQGIMEQPCDIWPVRPRRKPLLKNPTIILDLPDIQNHLGCSGPLDWSATGYIATIYEGEVHFWHPDGKRMEATNTSMKVGDCLKWNRRGDLLAFAMDYVRFKFALWDIHTQKVLNTFSCCSDFCQITAMEWTKSNDIITGCSGGLLRSWRLNVEWLKGPHVQMDGSIACIKLSSREKFCAIVANNSTSRLKLITWPHMKPHCDIHCHGLSEKISIDWHPWKDCLLAVGLAQGVSIWNVNTLDVIGHCLHHLHRHNYVDALAFNPVSGELLISAYRSQIDESTKVYLTVLRNCETIVDEVEHYNGREPYLYWDASGTKLAVAGSHESLCIWDFFGSSSNEIKKKCSQGSRLTSNPFETLKLIGPTIR